MLELKELEDYIGYFAGSDGHVYSKRGHGMAKTNYSFKGRKLSAGRGSSGTGYLQVSVRYTEGNRITKLVHRLICEAWYGDKPKNMGTR